MLLKDYRSEKPDLSDKIKRDFFQHVTLSILIYVCTTWRQTKRIKKKKKKRKKKKKEKRSCMETTQEYHFERVLESLHLKRIQERRTGLAGEGKTDSWSGTHPCWLIRKH